jgi:hypothetical protein
MLTAVVGLAVVGVLGYGWLKEHDRRVRESATAERSRDSLVTVVAEAEIAARYRHATDSANYEAAKRLHASELRAARVRADSISLSADSLARLLLVGVPDDLRGVVERLVAAMDSAREAHARERQAADSAIGIRESRIASLESTYARDMSMVRSQLATAIVQLDRANRRAQPGLLTRIVRALPVVLGTIGAWEGIKRL